MDIIIQSILMTWENIKQKILTEYTTKYKDNSSSKWKNEKTDWL